MSLVRQIDVLQDSAERPATLLVFLPPAQASIEDYLHQGFISALRERHICADALLAAITYEDVMSKTVAQRLHTCVIRPAITKGYSQIWLVGISLGAFNALHYAAIHANEEQSRTLATLRDTLLPKLLSGELSVSTQTHLYEHR